VIADHDTIDELLAGYILRALEGPDAAEADRLLAEHVPDCATCRTTLTDLQAVTGDLAVSVAPLAPPEMLLPRLAGELEPRRMRRLAGWSPARLVAAAAAVVVLIGIAGLALTSADGGGQTLAQADLAQIRSIAAQPGAETTDLGEADEVTAPNREETYVMGTGVVSPPSGMIYRLWAVGSSGTSYLGDFAPVNGIVALELTLDETTVQLLVTLEPADSEPATPGQPAWPAA
jgi:Anti-sigma-K factor rskA